jgi:hypothetical protein
LGCIFQLTRRWGRYWNRDADIIRLAFGGGIIIFALYLNEWFVKQKDRAQLAVS